MDNRRYIGFLPDSCGRDLGCVIGEICLWARTGPFVFLTSFGLVENFRIVGSSEMVTAGEVRVLPRDIMIKAMVCASVKIVVDIRDFHNVIR